MLLIDVEIKTEGGGGIGGNAGNSIGATKTYEINLEMGRKLDWIMKVMLDYIDYTFEIKGECTDSNSNIFGMIDNKGHGYTTNRTKEEIEEHNEIMLDRFVELSDIFERCLLVTYQPKYVQFLFFYVCSNKRLPNIVKTFLTTLIDNIILEDTNKLVRINSTNYLASMISRAKYIKFSIVEATVSFLLQFLIKYTDKLTHVGLSASASASAQKNKPSIIKGYEQNSHSKSNNKVATGDGLSSLNSRKSSAFNFMAVEFANNMKKYKISSELFTCSTDCNMFFNKLQQHDVFYYTVMAIMYIYSYRIDDFIENNSFNELNEFINLLKKYDEKLLILMILPTRILRKFHDISSKIPLQHYEFIIKIQCELDKDKNIIKTKSRRPRLMEEYYPFDPHFLCFSKDKFINLYLFNKDVGCKSGKGLTDDIDSVIASEDLNTLLSNPNEDSSSLKAIMIKEKHGDKDKVNGMKDMSDSSSYISKYETEGSAGDLKTKNENYLLNKRKGIDINSYKEEIHDIVSKKVKKGGV